jgi:hypothetical protein
MKNNFSSPGFLWPLLVLICLIVILYGLQQSLNKTKFDRRKKQLIMLGTLLCFALWITTLTVLSYKGFFTDFRQLPPRPVLAMLLPLPIVLLISFSSTGTQILKAVQPHWLILMQSFRILVEVLIWFAVLANKFPIQMSFEGRNFDIFSGLLALTACYILIKKPNASMKIIIAYNVIGMVLLLNILIVALLSMPLPIRYFMNDPSAALVSQFPFILLPGVLVPIAYSFHIFSLRQVWLNQKYSLQQKSIVA